MSHPPEVHQPQDILRGYASMLAVKFSGELSQHSENVAAVAHEYNLGVDDLCYCFLCLEEVGSTESDGQSGLSLKKWGTGAFAARIWTVVLARFVKASQKERGALDTGRVEIVCAEWQYKSEHFMAEMQSVEACFLRKFGQALLYAFQNNDMRQQELARARQKLGECGKSVAPQSSRLALALTDQAGSSGSFEQGPLPALAAVASRAVRPGHLSALPPISSSDAADEGPRKRARAKESSSITTIQKRGRKK